MTGAFREHWAYDIIHQSIFFFEEPRMDEAGGTPKFSRLTRHVILGGLIGGVLSIIPGLNILNSLFCILGMAGVVLALWMYLRTNPQDSVSVGESAGFGAMAGALAGLLSGAVTMAFFGGTMLDSILDNLPSDQAGALAAAGVGTAAVGIFAVIVSMVVFAAFGALGGILGMQLFFRSRIRKP
jgi:hypothetical protein